MTVKELKKEIENVPDSTEIILLSDSGSLDSVFAQYDDVSNLLILDGAYRKVKHEEFAFVKKDAR